MEGPASPERVDALRLSAVRDIHAAAVAGLHLRLATALGQPFAHGAGASGGTAKRSPVLRAKLAAVASLNVVGRQFPRTALVIERSLKAVWWKLTGNRRGSDQSKLFSPFLDANERKAPSPQDPVAARSKGDERFGDEGLSLAPDTADAEATRKEDAPLISVVIPCFNYGEFVSEAVASVLSQTFRDFEIVLVDGGSTDGTTPAVVRSLAAQNVRVFTRDKPHRVGSNRNFGIERARGRYVCCLDADDRLHPTYLEKAVFLLEHYGYDVVSASVQLFGLEGSRHPVSAVVDLETLLQDNEVATCGVFRRSLWKTAGGFRDHGTGTAADHVHEDWEFWVRLAAGGARIFNIADEFLFQYRVHGTSSLSRRSDVRSNAEQRQVIIAANSDVLTEPAIRGSAQRAAGTPNVAEPSTALLRNAPPLNERCMLVLMPWTVLGGAERLLSTVLSKLKASGWRIVIVTTMKPNPADGDTTEWFSAFTSELFNLPTYLPETSRWASFLTYLVASRGVGKVLLAGSAFGYDCLPRIKAQFSDVKVYDLLFNTVGHTGNNRRNAGFIDRHIVENREVRDWLTDRGESADRISLVPSGVVVPPRDPAAAHDVRTLLGAGTGDLVVGFSGRWSEEKNPLGFIDIAAELLKTAGIRFVMTGVGQMQEEVARRINTVIGPTDRFLLLYDLDDLAHVMPAYDLLVVPSKLDGRPQVVLEALALGVPVVASRVGGLPDIVHHRVHGALCDPDKIETFVSEIGRLKADPDELRRYKEAAREFALSELDATDMVRRFETALAA